LLLLILKSIAPKKGEIAMSKVNRLLSCIICIFFILPAFVQADDATELKKKIMFDQKKLIVMQNMEFSEQEGKAFWPVYNEFQEELFQVDQRAAKLIVAYAASYQTLTDDQAAILVGEYLDIQKSRIDLFDKYLIKLSKYLPAKKVFRYMQVENKMEAISRYEISKEIPLAQ
jgi:hypothetical protein